ncbi:sulfate transporter family-domain-containing protein [Pilaira anomala]|nr:sulfate transporter family-domain-containing protein [Pilaira anomala]
MTTIYVDNPPARYIDQIRDEVRQLPSNAKSYLKGLFPIVHWITKYNLIWFSGDLTAAITIGTLVIPQSLAYAKIANLPPVLGLYTSFLGVIIYPLFGTSKDISIGVSAISSLMIGQVMGRFYESPQYLSGEWTVNDAAINVALFSGFVILLIGLLRLGAIFHFISQPAIAGFMAGSGLTIVINQFSKIFGIPNINTSEAPYLVFGKTLINLHHSTLDASFGVAALVYLYAVKYASIYLMRHYPQHSRFIFFFNTSRSIVVLVFGTLLCYMINHFGKFESSPIHIIGVVPAGFGHMNLPQIKPDILSFFTADLPGIIVLLIMEHGVISNSLGKISDYKVDMSQETLAIGLANIFGAFFGSYTCTGAFTRSAVMSKSGARTPLASFFVGIIVVLAIYVFTPAFTYIPNASLAAIIAHSVTDLIFGPTVWKRFWDLNPGDLLIFALAYIIALVARIDISVYVPVAISLVIQLYRTARPNYALLGRMDLVETDALDEKKKPSQEELMMISINSSNIEEEKTLFYPLDHPTLGQYTRPVDDGMICFQPQESILFQNSDYFFEKLLDEVKRKTRRGKPLPEKLGDRTWNNATTSARKDEQDLALLHAIVLDLSGVHQMDYSGMEALKSVAIQIERYAGNHVHWYIVTGESSTVRKCLLFAGFGNQRRDGKRVGEFLSDLRHGVEEGGHTPGIEGCCSFVHQREKSQLATEEQQEKKQQGGDFDNVVTIEQARRPNRSHLDHHKRESIITVESLETDRELNTTLSNEQWCYCSIRSPPSHGQKLNGIKAVHDLYPYFFKSIHEAVRTALSRKQENDHHHHHLDEISVISDRGVNTTHSVGESSST